MFLKKTAVFFTTMVMVFALNAVDVAYSDMLRSDSFLSPQLKKVNESNLVFSMLGKSVNVDLTGAEKIYGEIKSHVEERFYGGNKEIAYESFASQSL